MINKWKYILLLLGLWGLPACESKEDLETEVQALIDNRIAERKDAFVATLRRNCTERVLKKATLIVDSIVIAEARLKKDTIPKPLRPDRPQVPEPKQLKDTLPVSPLFPDSLEIDTISKDY